MMKKLSRKNFKFLIYIIIFIATSLLIRRNVLASQYLTLPLNPSTFSTTTSLFDHDNPGSPANNNFTRYNGMQWTDGSASLNYPCTNAVNCYDGHNGIDYETLVGTNVLAAAPWYC